MSTAKIKHTEDAGVAQCSKASSILVRTHHQGEETQVHRVLPSTPEVSGNPADLVARALYGRVKKDYKPVSEIRKGLPVSSVLNLARSLQTTENYLLPIIGISDRTLQRRRKEKKLLDPVESDRLYRLAKVYARAHEVFEDEEVALDWLKSGNRALGDVPLMLLDTEAGTDMVERVLTRIEHGVYS
ncbi:MAG: type II RES/Xre toxin-antitoxin system antitoxin [Pseudomonadota bacterium]